jgi:hypothetical protein
MGHPIARELKVSAPYGALRKKVAEAVVLKKVALYVNGIEEFLRK